VIDDFRDGVWWVGLAPVRDPSLVLSTVASVVGAKGSLSDALKGKRLLLLLDNFEQVVEAAREIGELLQTCSDVAVLVTSREPLHIDGEREYALPPLPEAPAVELFRQRADAIAGGFDADYRVLVQVCDRLDSLPLAIELAAARTKSLSVADLLDRLDERLPLLTSRRRDVDDRQRTLRATIEWSHDLLSDDEKEWFACVSVFAGSFDVAAAEQVCDADVDALESLVDKSLLRTTSDGRFFMFETIREFAANTLASQPDADDVAAGHAQHFLRLAEEAAPHLTGSPEQAVWFGRLERDLDNLRAALSFCREHDEHELEFQLAVALWEFWWTHGYVSEGRRHLLHALQSAGVPDTSIGVNALEGACYLSYLDGDDRDARAWSDRLMQLAERLGDDVSLAHAWHMRALLARDDDERVRLESRVIELVGDDPYARHSVESLGLVALRRGDLDAARRYIERVIEIGDRARDRSMVSGALILLSVVSAELGQYDEAVRNLRAGTEEARRIGDKTPFVWERAWIVTSVVLTARGSPGDACRVLGAAERLREDEGSRLGGFTEEFHRRAVAKIQAVSSVEEVERAWQEGRNLASREYLDETLGRLD
jgi:predicted ATPase